MALFYSARYGHINFVEYLIAMKANINKKYREVSYCFNADNKEYGSIDIAKKYEHYNIVKYLLDFENNIDIIEMKE